MLFRQGIKRLSEPTIPVGIVPSQFDSWGAAILLDFNGTRVS